MAVYTGFRGDATVADITSRIPVELVDALTGAQLGYVMNAINKAYHDGCASRGAEVIDGGKEAGAVYVNCLDKVIDWKTTGQEYETIVTTAHGITSRLTTAIPETGKLEVFIRSESTGAV